MAEQKRNSGSGESLDLQMLERVANKEKGNHSSIYLYRQQNGLWYAYERSAYYFSVLFKGAGTLSVCAPSDLPPGLLSMEVAVPLEFAQSQVTRQTSVTTPARNVILISFSGRIVGFEQWRRRAYIFQNN